jgi:hypothetical protein
MLVCSKVDTRPTLVVYPPTQLIGPSAIELMAKGGPEVL